MCIKEKGVVWLIGSEVSKKGLTWLQWVRGEKIEAERIDGEDARL